MIELFVVIWLCKKNSDEALERGHNPVGYVFLTIGLWFGLETIAVVIGILADAVFFMYIFGLLFAGLGGFISHRIVKNLKQGTYTRKVKSQRLLNPAQITIVRRENGGPNSFETWDFSLNGQYIGKIEDGASLTVMTYQQFNVLSARNFSGAVSKPFELFVNSGWHVQISFKAGWFLNDQRVDMFPQAGPGASFTQGAPR